MCGRYTLGKEPDSLYEQFQLHGEVPGYKVSYNIAPSESAPIVYRYGGHRLALLMRWGMIPKWSKEPKTKYSTINAKAETLTESKLYAGPFKHTRCLVNNMMEGCQIIDYDWRYVYVNDTAAIHGRRKPEEMLMHTMQCLHLHPGNLRLLENSRYFGCFAPKIA